MTAPACHLCGGALRLVPGLEGLARVTSDCRAWPTRAALFVCGECGCLQKGVDAAWRQDAEEIYAGYAIYHQGAGAEQTVFAPETGQAASRSERLLTCLAAAVDLPACGRLLDVGCGNGALLRAFHRLRPGWSLVGTEREAMLPALRGLPGVDSVHAAPPGQVPGTFQLACLVHVLEHVEDPEAFLRQLAGRLTPEGRLLIEVPDFRQNPFDLVIADHCTHFTRATAQALLRRSGLEAEVATTDWVAKELTLVARRGPAAEGPPADAGRAAADGAAALGWLTGVLDAARSLAARGPIGLFGTSIAGTWMAGQLGRAVAFFVDEDPHRAGRSYLGRPIHAPRDAPADSDVFLALAPRLGAAVRERLREGGVTFRCHLPPGDPPGD